MAGLARGHFCDTSAGVTGIGRADKTWGFGGTADVLEKGDRSRSGENASHGALRSGIRADSLPRRGCARGHRSLHGRDYSSLPRRRRRSAKRSARRHGTESFGISAEMAVVVMAHGYEYRSPARTELDGVFSRKGESLAITERAEDYAPGDLVTWDLRGNVPHIGIVVDQ